MKVKCKWCGNVFEKKENVSRVVCPKCGKENVYFLGVSEWRKSHIQGWM